MKSNGLETLNGVHIFIGGKQGHDERDIIIPVLLSLINATSCNQGMFYLIRTHFTLSVLKTELKLRHGNSINL